ncbi:hypothetical protein GGI22_005156, partial [Coemansia erecta]
MSKQHHSLRTAADEVRRRASDVQRPVSSGSNGSAIDFHNHQHHGGAVPGVDHGNGSGWSAGFNGIVFGSGGGGGGDIAGLPGVLGTTGAHSSNAGLPSRALSLDPYSHTNAGHAAAPLTSQAPRLNSSIVMEHIAVLQRENAQLRRQNQTLMSATNMRRQTAVKLLREIVSNDDGASSAGSSSSSLSGNPPSKSDLTSLLLSLLDASDPETIENRHGEGEEEGGGGGGGGGGGEEEEEEEEASNQPPTLSHTTAADTATRDPASRGNNALQRSATPRSTTAVMSSDWDRNALAEIARQGKMANDESADDEYLKQTQKALGHRGPFALGRRSTMTMPARGRPFTASTHSLSAESEKEKSPVNATHHPGAYPTDNAAETAPAYVYHGRPEPPKQGVDGLPLQDDLKLGPLATSLINHKSQFVKRPDTRFILYSPSAGLFESHTLDGLRSGDMTLADIIEASARCMSLDRLRKERIAEHEAVAAVDKISTQSQSQQNSTTAAVDDSMSFKSTPGESETELLIGSRRKSDLQKQQLPVPQPMSKQQSAAPASSQGGGGCFWLDITNPTNEEMA